MYYDGLEIAQVLQYKFLIFKAKCLSFRTQSVKVSEF